MTRKQITVRIAGIICRKLAIEEREIDFTWTWKSLLGIDSLDQVELMMQIEDEFDCDISHKDADRLACLPVSAAVDWIAANMAARRRKYAGKRRELMAAA